MVKLVLYENEKEVAINLIREFWLAHNQLSQTEDEALEDLKNWTNDKHKFYFITYNNNYVGFIHLGSRGCAIDWLEDIFVTPKYQRMGIGTKAIALIEDIVRDYSVSLYIEAAARNEAAIRLYRNLGFNCLNTITIRKDFPKYEYDVIKKENIHNMDFEVRKNKTK